MGDMRGSTCPGRGGCEDLVWEVQPRGEDGDLEGEGAGVGEVAALGAEPEEHAGKFGFGMPMSFDAMR